ncbi:hypothetical protein DFH08DRAFT_986798, partial [Mycena albidolilacea]
FEAPFERRPLCRNGWQHLSGNDGRGNIPPTPVVKALDISATPGTRHYALLNTNEPPNDSEFAFIHSVISDADARLACLDDEISTLEEKLQQLEEEHASLSSYRTRNKAILSPLRRMPPEVLGEIFSLTLP